MPDKRRRKCAFEGCLLTGLQLVVFGKDGDRGPTAEGSRNVSFSSAVVVGVKDIMECAATTLCPGVFSV
ncbi:hypothetical protein BaRGS_00012180 [Batillaria attramentaria]|uniref:Uncharacterized protein n=1 Tax=Batillaria attramentaria TaxID=370345 RepID=A0ABD0LB99_9CAEN